MALSQVEEKLLGRLAQQTAPSNPLLSASLYQVLGLSVLLSRKLYSARKLRRLDTCRATTALELHRHIIWLAREGLSITEAYVLPYCQQGEQGRECRVMAAKLRASLYHVFCLFHNHPTVGQLSARSPETDRPPSSKTSPTPTANPDTAPLRDPVPSMQSDASFVTNPYVAGMAILPPGETAGRTPSRPPGLPPIDISAAQSAASFLLPPLNFVPMAREHFETAERLANTLLSTTHALRLCVALEHSAFLRDCAQEPDRSRRLAQRTIHDVYASPEALDGDECADAPALVQALGGMAGRGGGGSPPPPPPGASTVASPVTPQQRAARRAGAPPVDRTIAVSPQQPRHDSPPRQRPCAQGAHASHVPRIFTRTPERLSTVAEAEGESTDGGQTPLSAPVSRLSSRSRPPRTSSVTSAAASDKASKRKLVERAEEQARGRPSLPPDESYRPSREHDVSRSGRRMGQEGSARRVEQESNGESSQVHMYKSMAAVNHEHRLYEHRL